MSINCAIPLCVDLDGTLVKQDLFFVALINYLKKYCCLNIFILFIWLIKGRATLKAELAKRSEIDLNNLCFNLELLKFLTSMHSQGRTLYLVTGNDKKIATRVGNYIGIFFQIIASDGKTNLTGQYKANELSKRFGDTGFDYVGNSYQDLPVWEIARKVYVVSDNQALIKKIKIKNNIVKIFNWK